MLFNSAVESVKIGVSSVFISGPAGNQYQEQEFETVRNGQGGRLLHSGFA
jgi:hypothetical protein